jgi:hypothetical protein
LIYNDVQLFWAKDENNDIAIIYDLQEQDRYKKYSCPICGSEVKPVAIEGMTKDGKVAQVTGHFSHFDASKCSSESAIHYWFKNKMLINGDSFIIKTDTDNEYKCKDVLIEQSYSTEYGVYIPDITVLTECGQTIYFEMNYTNKKKVADYLDKWLELKNPVVEVDLKMLSNAMFNKTQYEFKPLFYEGKCFNTKKSDPYYDTVGQHKEKLYRNYTISEDIKNRLKKLDWFWLETINYKKGETNIEQLIDYIDYADQEDRELLFLILSKKRCLPIYEDYINYKVELFEKLGLEYINKLSDDIKSNFTINKIKEGRKYRNIKYNTIRLKNTYLINSICFDLTKYTNEKYIQEINYNIEGILELIKYYNKSMEISSIINNHFEVDILHGLKLTVDKSISYNDTYLCKLSLCKNGYFSYSSPATYMSIYIGMNHIRAKSNGKYYNSKNLNILDNKNQSLIVEFIINIINNGIDIYKQDLIRKEELKKEQKLKNMIEKRNTFNLALSKIAGILDNNKDKIIEYVTDFIYEDKCNLLYFKDYRNLEFIVHSGDNYIHDINLIEEDCSNPFYKYKGHYNLIELPMYYHDEIYIIETNDSYEIMIYNLYEPDYEFPNIFNDIEINLSFRHMGYNTKFLPRYDFMNATIRLNELLTDISEIINNYVSNLYEDNNKIYFSNYQITDESINKEIYKILYPLICLANKKSDNILNIKLNSDFTKQDGKTKPWLIKDFIEALRNIGVKNIHNII